MVISHPRLQRRSILTNGNKEQRILVISVVLNAVLLSVLLLPSLLFFLTTGATTSGAHSSSLSSYHTDELVFHGGHPEHGMKGSCVCTSDYCMCGPALAIDLVIVTGDRDHVLLVRRKDTDQLATMGGFVKVGETVDQAIHRELKEEMGLSLTPLTRPVLLGIYSDPRRDNRRHTASAAYVVQLDVEHPAAVAADDAKEVVRLALDEIESTTFFSDHKTIITDYLNSLHDSTGSTSGKQRKYTNVKDNFDDVKRSLCPLVDVRTD